MGELRAYAVDLGRLRELLGGGPGARDEVVALVRPLLAPGPAPAPLGPVFTRVPGTRVVRDDDPSPADLDRLLGGEPVLPDRLRATWRLVEALVAGVCTSSTCLVCGPPQDLRPLVALAQPDGLRAGVRDRSAPDAGPLRAWADTLDDRDDVVVLWRADAGPTG